MGITDFEASLKMVIPRGRLMVMNSDERFPRRLKTELAIKLKSDGIKKYRHISDYNPGIYELFMSFEGNQFGPSDRG